MIILLISEILAKATDLPIPFLGLFLPFVLVFIGGLLLVNGGRR